MAKLTNRQMDVLAERVTDLLEEANIAKRKEIEQTKEYLEYEARLMNKPDSLYNQLIRKVVEIQEVETKLEVLKEQTKAFIEQHKEEFGTPYFTSWRNASESLKDIAKNYLVKSKEKAYPETGFDRDKTLRKVQADILLSDVANPDELVRSIVEKLK